MKKNPVKGPLGRLEALLKRSRDRAGGKEERPSPVPTASRSPEKAELATDEELLRLAMEGVARNSGVTARSAPLLPLVRIGRPGTRGPASHGGGGGRRPELMVQDHPEYIEGWVGRGGQADSFRTCAMGLYSIQGQIDLHGMSREEARIAVEEFVSADVAIPHLLRQNHPRTRDQLPQ